MVDLRQLRQFIAVAEELHFHKAAARLNMSQPPLTASVRKLEDEVGAELIERRNRTIRLTAAGAAFLEEARRTLRQADWTVDAAREAAQGRTGTVRVSYVGSALYGRLPRLIRRFRQECPTVRLELREATSAQQIAMLRSRLTDIAVLITPVADSADMTISVFDADRLAIAVSRDHRLARRRRIAVGDLANEPFVLWPAIEGRGFHVRAIRLCTQAGFTPSIVQEALGMHAVLSLVAVGAGVSIVPGSMATFRADEIVYHPIHAKEARFDRALCWNDPVRVPAVRRFIALAKVLPR